MKYDHIRFHLHRAVCRSYHAWNQACGEPQHDARAGEGTVCGWMLEVILQGGVREFRAMGVADSSAGGFRADSGVERCKGLAGKDCRGVRL